MITVSDEFVKIYKNFNVVDQVEEMKKLSKRELYLLMMFCLDVFSEDDPVVKFNLSSFQNEMIELDDLVCDKEVSKELSDLSEETGDKYIETDNIIDLMGNKLPEPLTKEQVRDAKINLINNIDN